MAGATGTMLPEPSVDVKSPRVRAAMRVLGIAPKDLVMKDRSEFEDGMPGEVKHGIHERKRRQLLTNILQWSGEQTLSPTSKASLTEEPGPNAYLQSVLANEKKNLDKIRNRAKADIQKIVETEMAAKDVAEQKIIKEQEHAQRMKEKKKERDQFLKEQSAAAEKRLEKSIQVKERCDRQRKQEAEERFNAIMEKNEKVEAALEERKNQWEEHRQKCQEERLAIYARQDKHVAAGMQVRERAYQEILVKDRERVQRLEDLVQDRTAIKEARREKTNATIAKAKLTIAEAQERRDKNYLDRLEAHVRAREYRDTVAAETLKEISNRNKKEVTKILKAKEKKEKEVDKHYENPEMSGRLTRCLSDSFSSSPAWRTQASDKSFEVAKTMHDLISINQTHLRRAKEYHQEQALKKILSIKDRVEALEDSKFQAQQRRYDMLKNVAIEKYHMTHQVDMVRDAPPHKLNAVLEDFGLPPIKKAPVEGEEEEKKT